MNKRLCEKMIIYKLKAVSYDSVRLHAVNKITSAVVLDSQFSSSQFIFLLFSLARVDLCRISRNGMPNEDWFRISAVK